MRARQPFAQLCRGVVWCVAVEGHERRRDPGQPDKLRPPAIVGDTSYLDRVLASSNDRVKVL